MAICPHCGREVPDDAIVCPYCGAQLNPDVAVCGNCGHIIPADAKVCPYCGAELSDMARCPNCGREIPANSKSCPYCGYVFEKNEEPVNIQYVTPAPVTNPSKTITGIKEKPVASTVTPASKAPLPRPQKSNFWKGFGVGFIIAILITAAIMTFLYVQPLQKENQNLRMQLEDLKNNYTALSLKYNSLVLNYTTLNQNYIQKVQDYNSLLAQYMDIKGKYDNLTDFQDEKFIVLLFFTTDYGNNKYWLYLEIDPQLYLSYKEMPHLSGTSEYMDEFKNYVVTDSVMQTIVNAVQSKLTTSSEEEFADALLSIVQNKIANGENGNVYENLNNVPGTYYSIDTPAKYPVETLVLHSGECLDDSIFYGSLLKTANLKSAFLFFSQQQHVMIGVALPNAPHHNNQQPTYWYIDYYGTKYYTGETTGYGWKVGDLDQSLQGASAYVIEI